jgi:hypothetical protein
MTLVLAAAAKNIKTATVQQRYKMHDKTEEQKLFGVILRRKHIMMDLADIRNELDKSAKKLADFRGSL